VIQDATHPQTLVMAGTTILVNAIGTPDDPPGEHGVH
jgi:hypothetical protein